MTLTTTAITKSEAREIVDSIKEGVADVWALIVSAYERQAWEPLGYASWDALCAAEFASMHLRLPSEQRAEKVASLRANGLSIRAIASATGAAVGTVHEDLSTVRNRTVELPDRITGIDGKSRPAKHTFDCPTCHKTFDHKVRHCATCGRHWPSNQDCPICSADPGLAESRQQSRKQEEERRDAQALLNRIIDLTVPRASVNGWLDAWATRLGPSPHSLIEQTRAAGEALIHLSERMTSDL